MTPRDRSTLAHPSLALFNPDLLSGDDLARQFVVRTDLLDRLVADFRADGSPNHHIIIGQRGMGKTTMLRRLRLALDQDSELAGRWQPLAFPEEQYNITRLSDLWVNCLDALGDALDEAGDAAAAADVDATVASLPDDEGARSAKALDALVQWAAANRGLVLLIDNLDLVLERLDETDHWAIREVLGEEGRLVLVGASSKAADYFAEYQAAFYEFLRPHELRGLDAEASRRLLRRLAELYDAPEVLRVLDEEPGRVAAIHVLTGGNPRTMVLLYRVLAEGESTDVHVDLQRLLDECTPLYKERLEALPGQAQAVVDALAVLWDPATAAEVAEKSRLDVNPVSSHLHRLARAGIVEKVALHKSKRQGFQLAERFFNIWYLMRASRRLRKRLSWLVRFLEDLYSGDAPLTDGPGGPALAWQDPPVARRQLTGGDDVVHASRWPANVAALREAVRQGHAADAVDLLSDPALSDRYRPLLEALRAVVAGTEDHLLDVAPEIRLPARQVLDQIWPPDQR